ncbi:hypothetical protein [Fibrobacter sp.]|uniref:hypothetical protein n=1 Tax=Fibrobacter sp. TaxID=35828 RepID=UPI00388FA136
MRWSKILATFYHKDPKTRSDYVTFKDMLEDERDEGRAEGRAEGLAEGRAEGLAEGRAEGRAEGAKAKAREMAKALKDKGVAINIIADSSGLSEDEIKAL